MDIFIFSLSIIFISIVLFTFAWGKASEYDKKRNQAKEAEKNRQIVDELTDIGGHD